MHSSLFILHSSPGSFRGSRSLDIDVLMAHGVLKVDASGMKADAAVGIAAWRTVFKIAADGTTDGSQLTTNLMMTSGVEMYLKERVTICMPYDLVVKNSLLRIRTLMVVGITLVLLLVAHKIMRQRSLRLARRVLHQRPVSFLNGLCTEHLIKACQGLAGAGKQHHPADGTVQTMHDAEKYGAGLCILLLNIQFHRLGERSIAGLVALHDFTCALRDDDNVIIFV